MACFYHRLSSVPFCHLERPHPFIMLHRLLVESPPDQPLSTEDGILRISGSLILCGLAHKPFLICKRDVGWCGPVALIVCEDLDGVVSPDTYAAVGRPKVNSNCWSFSSGHVDCVVCY
mmetsp:Transcript_27415/g.46145  ORF Transcript_27415/g.46145 Transcript_27415/m.46145 type:complete len:118 (+) Transcript_27415:1775-2128(+)